MQKSCICKTFKVIYVKSIIKVRQNLIWGQTDGHTINNMPLVIWGQEDEQTINNMPVVIYRQSNKAKQRKSNLNINRNTVQTQSLKLLTQEYQVSNRLRPALYPFYPPKRKPRLCCQKPPLKTCSQLL